MIDISGQGTVITFSSSSLGEIKFSDASDMGSPIEFGTLNPIGHEFDLNNNLVAFHPQIAPEMSLSFIPGSSSDRKLRAYLISSIMDANYFRSVSDVMIDSVEVQYPSRSMNGESQEGERIILREGYLVGGSAGLGVSAEGRLTSSPYRFVFKSIDVSGSDFFGRYSSDGYSATEITKDGSPIPGLYYARVSANSGARVIQHPIETGAAIFDQKFLEPERVSVSVKIPMAIAKDIAMNFLTILVDRSLAKFGDVKTPYAVNTKTDSYENLTLVRMSHDEIPDRFDLIEYRLEFQELMFSSTDGFHETQYASDKDQPPVQTKGTQTSRPSA